VDDAVAVLVATAYRHDLRPGLPAEEAEHAVGATLLWHLRVLAGWLPARGVQALRLMAAGFELANVDERVCQLTGGTAGRPYTLGALGTAARRIGRAGSLDALRSTLAASMWGDPGAATPRAITLGLRLAWAQRLAAAVPETRLWAAGAVALLVAREFVLPHRPVDGPLIRPVSAVLGAPALAAGALDGFAEAVRRPARWVFSGVNDPDDLWRAEAGWWRRVERDGFRLLQRSRYDREVVVGAVAVLAVDAWRVRAALACASRGGAVEVFDALA
jgi:hypothetical protein